MRRSLALPILLLAACSVRVNAERGAHRPDPAYSGARDEAREAMMQADRDFARATAARGVEGWVAYFEPNGSQVNGGTVTTGLAAIRALMTPTLSDTTVRLKWEPTDAVVTERGRLGSTVGRWQLVRRDSTGAEKVASTGSYLTVWRKQADGSWKVVTDVGSPD